MTQAEREYTGNKYGRAARRDRVDHQLGYTVIYTLADNSLLHFYYDYSGAILDCTFDPSMWEYK